MSKTEEYLNRIREIDGLKHAILSGICVNKREKKAEFFLVTDRAYSTMDEAQAESISGEYMPQGFSAGVRIVKRVPDEAILKEKIYAYLYKSFPAAAAFVTASDIDVEMLGSGPILAPDIQLPQI